MNKNTMTRLTYYCTAHGKCPGATRGRPLGGDSGFGSAAATTHDETDTVDAAPGDAGAAGPW